MIIWIKQSINWLVRFKNWLFSDGIFFVMILSLPLSFYFWWNFTFDCEKTIRLSGMFFEFFGLVTVAKGLHDTRRIFNCPTLSTATKIGVKNFPKFKESNIVGAANGIIQIKGYAPGIQSTSSLPASASIDERVEALENNLENFEKQSILNLQKQEETNRKHFKLLEEERQDRELGDEESKNLITVAAAGGINLETIGLFWLFFGIIFASASQEIVFLFAKLSFLSKF